MLGPVSSHPRNKTNLSFTTDLRVPQTLWHSHAHCADRLSFRAKRCSHRHGDGDARPASAPTAASPISSSSATAERCCQAKKQRRLRRNPHGTPFCLLTFDNGQRNSQQEQRNQDRTERPMKTSAPLDRSRWFRNDANRQRTHDVTIRRQVR